MQREFLQYAKKSLSNENVPFTLSYEPRKGDGRVLSQGLKIPGITPDLRDKGYYLTLTTDHHGQRTLCQPSFHVKGYGTIPGIGFEWVEDHKPKTIKKEVDIVDFREIQCNRRTYELFSTEEDIQEGDLIEFYCEEFNTLVIRKISSINVFVNEDEIINEDLIIASLIQ